MVDGKLRIGILGAARIARKNATAIAHPESACVVVAVASRTRSKAEVRAPQVGKNASLNGKICILQYLVLTLFWCPPTIIDLCLIGFRQGFCESECCNLWWGQCI